jgi:hypothetical protein
VESGNVVYDGFRVSGVNRRISTLLGSHVRTRQMALQLVCSRAIGAGRLSGWPGRHRDAVSTVCAR